MQNKKLTISIVIPTLNRADYISKLLTSVIKQSVSPDELVVVDQNENDITKNLVYKILSPHPEITINYIHDSSFNSLVKAKYIGSDNAKCEIISFLDDDIVLHPDYISNIIDSFNHKYYDMLGCMGHITNNTKKSKLYLFFHALFFQGIYSDDRPKILSSINNDSEGLINSNVLSGGASSWRKSVFKKVKIDIENNLHFFEDIDFSERVIKYFGDRLFVNTNAKMEHVTDQTERLNHFKIQKIKACESIIYYKKRTYIPWSKRDLVLLLVWRLSEALISSAKYKTLSPVRGYISGVKEGIYKKAHL